MDNDRIYLYFICTISTLYPPFIDTLSGTTYLRSTHMCLLLSCRLWSERIPGNFVRALTRSSFAVYPVRWGRSIFAFGGGRGWPPKETPLFQARPKTKTMGDDRRRTRLKSPSLQPQRIFGPSIPSCRFVCPLLDWRIQSSCLITGQIGRIGSIDDLCALHFHSF